MKAVQCGLAAVFAGYQVHLAQELINNGTVPPNAEFNPLQFALGFGAHVAGDGAGFYPGGYLGNGHVTPGLVNWVSLWQFMTTVDSHMLKNYSIPYQSLPTSALPRQGSSFISQATQYASSKGATFPVLDDSAAYNCTQVWSQVVNRNVRVANAFSRFVVLSTTPSMPFSSFLLSFFCPLVCVCVCTLYINTGPLRVRCCDCWHSPTTFDDLVFFDNYGATSPLQAVAHLDMAVNCAVKTIAAWVPEVTKSGVTPESAAKTAYGTLEKLVALGACNPPTAEQAAVFRAP